MATTGIISNNKNLTDSTPCQFTYHNIPLNIFIDQCCDGIIEKEILEQFLYDTRSTEQSYIHKLATDILILDSKFSMIEAAVTYLDLAIKNGIEKRDADIMAVLKQHIAINDEMPLRIIYAKAKRFLTDIEVKKAEYDKIANKDEGVKDFRKYFAHLVISVQGHNKYQINKNETTAYEFALMINEIHDYIKSLKSKQNARG